MTADHIKALLRQRYGAPTHAIFFEVPDATGAQHRGYADAISMSLWPSHGLEIHGFEIKVSRRDWGRELERPEKAERFAARCDRWWLVTSPDVVERESDVPAGWGWMVAHAPRPDLMKQQAPGGLVIARPAAKLEPAPLDRLFLASILRRASIVDAAEAEAAARQKLAELRRGFDADVAHKVQMQRSDDKRDAEIMAKVREVLREVDDHSWMAADEMAAAIIAVYRSGAARSYDGLAAAADALEKAAATIRGAHASLALPAPAKTPKRSRAA